MSLKLYGMEKIIGKTISGVIVKENNYGGSPRAQLFLMFDDDTYYEFYVSGDKLNSTSDIDMGSRADVRRYMDEGMDTIVDLHAEDEIAIKANGRGTRSMA